MKSEDACVGKRVRVREDHSKADLRGRRGTIIERWGNPSHAALDVLLDGGEWQLFWYHELEEFDEEHYSSSQENRASSKGVIGQRQRAES